MARNSEKYVVIVADDFGRSSSVNDAVVEAHERGILTAASIMAGGEAFEEAARIARSRSRLSVGLHVTLCDGCAVLSHSEVPDLVDGSGHFEKSPSRAWMKYTRAGFLEQLDAEIEAQFDRLEKAGIHTTHVDGHHHLHMHPAIFKILCRQASQRGVRWIRIPREPLSSVFRHRSTGRGAMPFIEWVVFGMLTISHARKARKYGLTAANAVYGLSRTGKVDEKYLLDVLTRPGGLSEIFTHPDTGTETGRRELEALTSTAVRRKLSSLGITLAGYRQLSEEAVILNTALERS
jgi:hopanoid biosynthesis associated protein HpnK